MINIPGGKVGSTEIYGSYTVVLSPTGAEGDALPDGGVEVKVDDQTYLKFGDTPLFASASEWKNRDEIVQLEATE